MEKLNLPEFDHKIRHLDGKVQIYDSIRKKYVDLQPEEWVRQNIIRYLVEHLNYPASLFRVERGLKYNKLNKRFDILVLQNTGEPFLLIECKSYTEKINDSSVRQIAMYNKSIGAKILLITNGLKHIILSNDPSNLVWKQEKTIPDFPGQQGS